MLLVESGSLDEKFKLILITSAIMLARMEGINISQAETAVSVKVDELIADLKVMRAKRKK
jgi:hypothetical protein